MKNKKIWIAIALIAFVVVAGTYAQAAKVVINFKLNTQAEDPTNTFTWTADKQPAVKDAYSATTGASSGGSTEKFNVVYDKDGKKTLPATLRGLFLYAVSSRADYLKDAVEVKQNADKSLTIRYFHRGTAYCVQTDAKGVIDLDKNPAKILTEVGDDVAGAFVVKPEYLKAGATDNTKWENADWDKVTPKLTANVADAASKYTGKLTAKLDTKGIFTIQGTLTLKK